MPHAISINFVTDSLADSPPPTGVRPGSVAWWFFRAFDFLSNPIDPVVLVPEPSLEVDSLLVHVRVQPQPTPRCDLPYFLTLSIG